MTADSNQTPAVLDVTSEILDSWATDSQGPIALFEAEAATG